MSNNRARVIAQILISGLMAIALASCATRQPDAPMWGKVATEIGKW